MDGNSAEEIQAIKAFWWAGPSGIGMKKKHTKASVHTLELEGATVSRGVWGVL